MIYEIRTYTLRPRATAEFEKLWGAAYPARQKYSPIVGFFHTEFGPLNEVIHIWPYESFEARERARAESAKDPDWPPDVSRLILNQKVEVVTPLPFVPEWQPGPDGPIYELRQYVFQPGAFSAITENWKASLPERLKFSKPALIGGVEFGPSANSFIHIWPYASLEHRNEVRAKASASGKWPPGGGENYLTQSNKLLLPAAYSPAQ